MKKGVKWKEDVWGVAEHDMKACDVMRIQGNKQKEGWRSEISLFHGLHGVVVVLEWVLP